jgi:hypothetical protein
MKVRLAYSRNLTLTFTQRGRQSGSELYRNGFVRINGKTVSGYAYNSTSGGWTFYATGQNEALAFDVARANYAAAA